MSLGTALVTPELPRVWDASYFRAERADAGAQAGAEAVDLCPGGLRSRWS